MAEARFIADRTGGLRVPRICRHPPRSASASEYTVERGRKLTTSSTELKMQALSGTPLPDKLWSVGDYLDYWLEHVVSARSTTYDV